MPLSNDQMKADRFLRWHRARQTLAKMNAVWDRGGSVIVSTYTKATEFKAKHRDMIQARRDGLYAQRGKAWDFIGGCAIRTRG
jgi:hypothetical protein